jgi:hypothetical protein
MLHGSTEDLWTHMGMQSVIDHRFVFHCAGQECLHDQEENLAGDSVHIPVPPQKEVVSTGKVL